jgi:cytochrome c peroxidase
MEFSWGSNSLSIARAALAVLVLVPVVLVTPGCTDTSSDTEPAPTPRGTPLTAPAQPLQVSETALSFETDSDGAPETRALSVSTQNGATLWGSRTEAQWLALAPAQGRGSEAITLRVSPKGLKPGNYATRLLFKAKGFPDLLHVVNVRYTVHPKRGACVFKGNAQIGVVGAALPEALTVRVLNSSGKPQSGVNVEFETVAGSTEPPRLSVTSDSNGLARFQPKLLQYGAIGITASTALTNDSPAYFTAVATGWISTLAGDGVRGWGGDNGPATQANFNAPFGMAFVGNALVVVDYFNHALRAVDLETGVIRALVGTGKQGFNGDGRAPLETLLNGPFGVALGPKAEVIVGDYYNNRIRVVDAKSGTVSTLAGTGVVGYSGDGGPGQTAEIDVPLDIATDSKGNVYLSDWHHHVVRKVDAKSGEIETIAGIGAPGYSGEGDATQAALRVPLGLSVDRDGALYIADYGNHRIRKIDAKTGRISTVAGTGRPGYAGDGDLAVLAKLNHPYNVYVDANGGLFISDAGNHRIRHVDPKSGLITTIAGDGQVGYSGDRGLALDEKLKGPFSVITDDANTLYIAEYFGHRIRRVGGKKVPTPPPPARTDLLLRQSRQLFGSLPREAASTENPPTEAKIELGRQLFHDPRLSRDGSVSCSSCHALENFGMDGLKVAEGIRDQKGTFNSPSVFNAALQDAQFWDGREETVEAQAGKPLLNPIEMAMPDEAAVVSAVKGVPEYLDSFTKAFPDEPDPITFKTITFAVGAFERRLLTPGSSFDRFVAGDETALSSQELLGLEVFLREGCASCHSGPLLGGQNLHLIEEYPKTPAGDRFEFRKRLGNTHTFKVAPLRNIAKTAPYLHDGRYPTLEASLERRLIAYMVREAGIRDTVDLSRDEFKALLAFLRALTGKIDPDYIRTPTLPGQR